MEKDIRQTIQEAKSYFVERRKDFDEYFLTRESYQNWELFSRKSILFNVLIVAGLFIWFMIKGYMPFFNAMEAYCETITIDESFVSLLMGINGMLDFIWGVFALIIFLVLPIIICGSIYGIVGLIHISIKRMILKPLLMKRLREHKKAFAVLEEHYDNYEAIVGKPCPVSFNYCNPDIVSVLCNYIMDGQADNVKEAISEMKRDEHRRQMLSTQYQLIEFNNEILNETKRIRKASEATARNTFWARW